MRNQSPNLIAGGNILPFTFVKMSTAADNTVLQAGANARVIGIPQVGLKDAPGLSGASAYAAVAGDNIEIFGLGDVCNVLAGSGGFTHGDLLKSDATGGAIPIGTGVQQNIGAVALESAAAGEQGLVQIVFLDQFSDYAGASALLTDITAIDNSLAIRGQDGNNTVGGDIIIAAGAGNNNNTGGNVTILAGANDGTGTYGNIAIGTSNTTQITFGVNPRIPVASVAATVGGVIANANAVSEGYTRVTGSNNASSAVKLPASIAGKTCIVKNTVATGTLAVFPPVSSQINANGLNNVYNIPNGSTRTFYCYNTTLWETFLETISEFRLHAWHSPWDEVMTTETLTRREAIQAVLKIDGWLAEAEAGALYDMAKFAKGPIVEIGSWQGRSTAALALGSMSGSQQPVYAIDPFTGPPETQTAVRKTDLGRTENFSCSPELLRANLDAIGVNGLVSILPMTSAEAADKIDTCDVLFVDGDHEFEALSQDLELYLPKVLPGGKVMLHDVTEDDPGVPKACDKYLMGKPNEWRVRGRVDSAVFFEKGPTVKHSVYLACPGRGFDWGSVRGILDASRIHNVEVGNNGNGWDDFNFLWAQALNAFEDGKVTHWAMLHSDVVPQACWLDVLLGECDDLKADVVSTVIPIKDRRGVTSTGIGDWKHRWGRFFRRFTMHEIMDMPATFDVSATPHPDKFLLVNTGCWVADLRNPLFRSIREDKSARIWFDFPTKIARNDKGRWCNTRESEDWFFSRCCANLRMKVYATRKVQAVHMGMTGFPNSEAWGSNKCDEEGKDRWGKELVVKGDPTEPPTD